MVLLVGTNETNQTKPVNIHLFAVSAMLHSVVLLFVFPIFSWFLQLDCLSQQNYFHRFPYFEPGRDRFFLLWALISVSLCVFVRVCVIIFSENLPLACPLLVRMLLLLLLLLIHRLKTYALDTKRTKASLWMDRLDKRRLNLKRTFNVKSILFVEKMHWSPQRVKSMIDYIIGRIL